MLGLIKYVLKVYYIFKKQCDEYIMTSTFFKVTVHKTNKEQNYNNWRPTVTVKRNVNKYIKINLKACVNNHLCIITCSVDTLLHYSHRHINT